MHAYPIYGQANHGYDFVLAYAEIDKRQPYHLLSGTRKKRLLSSHPGALLFTDNGIQGSTWRVIESVSQMKNPVACFALFCFRLEDAKYDSQLIFAGV